MNHFTPKIDKLRKEVNANGKLGFVSSLRLLDLLEQLTHEVSNIRRASAVPRPASGTPTPAPDAVREDIKARLFARLRPIYPSDMLDSTWQIVEEVVFDGVRTDPK